MKLGLLLILSILLSGCGMFGKKKVEPIPDAITVIQWRTFDCGVPPARDPINLRVVNWKIIDGNFTLTSDMYGNLGENMSEILKGVRQLGEVVSFYESCIEAASSSVD